jgi:competence protein ComEA
MNINQLSIRSFLPALFCVTLSVAAFCLPIHESMAQPIATPATSSVAPSATSPVASPKALSEETAVSINTADAATIAAAMTGVGLKKAQAIVEWREKNGKYSSLDQLLEIKGIGAKTLDANKGRIKL